MRFHTTQCYAHSPFLDKAVKPRLTWVSMKSLLNLDFLLQQGFQYRQINFSVQSSHTKIQLIVSIFKVSKVLRYLIFVTDATDGVRVNFFWPV